MLTPLFAMLGSCDQTATDLGTRHIRFLIPRVGRAEIFIARFVGAAVLVTCAQLLAGVGATIVTLVASGGDSGEIIAFGAQVTAILIVYSLPFVALMSFVSAAMASVGLALLVGLGGYILLTIALSAVPLKGTAATIVPLLLPSGLKQFFHQPELGPAIAAARRVFHLRRRLRRARLAGVPHEGRVMADAALLETRGLGRDFGDTRALDSIDLTLQAGAPIGLVGPNGAGKTTFFSVLCGFLRPTRGTVQVLGRPPLHRDGHGRVGILPQDAAFVKGVPVASQLAMLAELQGFGRKQARAEAARVLEMVLLAGAAAKTPEALSHGMLKRIAIAQAFMGSPELVLLGRAHGRSRSGDRVAHQEPDPVARWPAHVHRQLAQPGRHRGAVRVGRGPGPRQDRRAPQGRRPGRAYELPDVPARGRCARGPRRQAVGGAERDAGRARAPGRTKAGGSLPRQRRRRGWRQRDPIAVLQALAAAGVAMLEMSRGQSLQDKVIEITRPAAG